jgi:hypothetical protein
MAGFFATSAVLLIAQRVFYALPQLSPQACGDRPNYELDRRKNINHHSLSVYFNISAQ